MDKEEAYKWGELFSSTWPDIALGMAQRAEALNLSQETAEHKVIWRGDDGEKCRWVFIDDPSDIDSIRALYNDDANIHSPSCFVVVKQPDPSDDRGDVIFDIFRLNPQSLLWHFNRVYTRPAVNAD